MVNSFDTDVAKDVGVVPAVIYQNIKYWCEKNRTNGKNEYEGLWWTYNSVKAFCEQFPYLTKNQINTALEKLIEAGYIKKGCYNKVGFDRTAWYADLRVTISEKSEMDFGKNRNPILENQKPIPNINTNINKDKKVSKKDAETFDSILTELVNPELHPYYLEFIKMRKLIKKPLTNYALKQIIKKVNELANFNLEDAKLILNQSIENSWQGVFPLKNKVSNTNKLDKAESIDDMLFRG